VETEAEANELESDFCLEFCDLDSGAGNDRDAQSRLSFGGDIVRGAIPSKSLVLLVTLFHKKYEQYEL
jgi:hypothetical protein